MGHLHSVYDTDLHFMIDPITRTIINQATAKTKLIQHDHNSERFTFEIPRFVESHDMSLCDKIEVHYINIAANKADKSEDVYLVDDVQLSPADDGVVIFSWLISGNATKYAGTLNFLIRFVCVTGETIDYAWHTEIYNKIIVSDGMNNSETVIAEYSDVLEAWKREIGLETLEDKTNALEKRVTNLEKRINPEPFETDATAAYKKTVPENALPYAEIESVDDSVTAIKSFGGNKVLSKDAVLTSSFRSMTVTDLGGGHFQFDGYTSWQDGDWNSETGEYNKYTFLSVPVKAGLYKVTKTLIADGSEPLYGEVQMDIRVGGERCALGIISVAEDTAIEIRIGVATGGEGLEGAVYAFNICEGVPVDNMFTQFETTSNARKTDNGGMNLIVGSTYGDYYEVARATLPAGTYNFSYSVDPNTPKQDGDTDLKIGTAVYNLSDVVTLTEEGTVGIYAKTGGVGESDSTIFYPSIVCFEPIAIDTLATPIGEDNFILVEPMGTLVFENEGNNAVPSTVTYMLKEVSE